MVSVACIDVRIVLRYKYKRNKGESMEQEGKKQENAGQENKKQNTLNDNIWDIIFKAILQEMPQMTLPLINEVFHENYGIDAEIIPLNNEFYNVDGSKVVSDTAFLVEKMLYHFECQFSNDKEMAFRMFEYDFHIALAGTKGEKRIDEIFFPKSCVVYITTNKNNPQKLSMKVKFPNGEFIYEVPTVRVHDYSFESIGKKKLLIFLPYMALRYSQKLKNKKPPTTEEIKQFYREMISTLETAYNDKVIGQWEYNMLLEMIKDVEERIFYNYPEIREEVDPMVTHLLNLESLKMRDETEQLKRELEQQKQKAEQAAKQASLSSIETMKKLGFTLTEEQIQEILKHAMEAQETGE